MLTLFTIPKPFHGHIAVIQRNAIKSWALLRPACDIILFGDEEGTSETASEFGVKHVPTIARNEFRTPLVNDIFEKAQELSFHNHLCYINADIILLQDFLETVVQVIEKKKHFLMIGKRWDIDIVDSIQFDDERWEERLKSYVMSNGKLHASTGIDYFVFSKGLYENIPPFAIGRTVWDNWLVYYARRKKVPVIDATEVITAIHQNHDYSHHPEGVEGVWNGEEAKQNLKMAGGYNNLLCIDGCNYKIHGNSKIRLRFPHFYSFTSKIYTMLRAYMSYILRRLDL